MNHTWTIESWNHNPRLAQWKKTYVMVKGQCDLTGMQLSVRVVPCLEYYLLEEGREGLDQV